MKPEPIWNQRVLVDDETLVVADLHIGYESELEDKGVKIPSQTDSMAESIERLGRERGLKRLIIVGDFKHNIPQASWQEYSEIPKVIDRLLKVFKEIHLVPGNHDGGIDRYMPREVTIHGSRGFVQGGTGYFHGHAFPETKVVETGQIVLAHTHPSITFRDGLDRREKKPCWVRLRFVYEGIEGEAVVLPHFNPLLGGTSLNEDGYLGPFLKKIDIKNEELFLLNGTKLGSRENLAQSTR